MQLKLSDLEIEILRRLVNGEAVSIFATARPTGIGRYDPAGRQGIALTLTGRSFARESMRTPLRASQRLRLRSPGIAAVDDCPISASPSFDALREPSGAGAARGMNPPVDGSRQERLA